MNDREPSTRGKRPVKFNIRERHMNRVESMLQQDEYVDGELLANALRDNREKPVPPDVLAYLCRYLDGKVEKPKGRKPLPVIDARQRQMIMSFFYNRNLTWLTTRNKRYGHLEGWPLLRGADFWQGPPNEIAARMVARRFSYGADSWRTIHNLISSQE